MMLRMNVNELQPLIVEIFDLSSGRDEADGAEGSEAASSTSQSKNPTSSVPTTSPN